MAEDRHLPGWPKKRLVRDVRRHLWSYGIRPTSTKVWLETWAWANQITQSYVYPRWPLPSEIAAQFVALLLLDMNANRGLKLPHRAMEQMPPSLRQRIEGAPLPLIGMTRIEEEKCLALPPPKEGRPVKL